MEWMAPIIEPHETAVVAKASVRIAAFWHLSAIEAATLFGVPQDIWDRMALDTRGGPLDAGQAARFGLLLGLWTDLTALFGEPLATDWPTLPNTGPLFEGRRPVDVMIDGGIPAIEATRWHVAALRMWP